MADRRSPGTEDTLPIELTSTVLAGDGEIEAALAGKKREASSAAPAGRVERWGHFVLLGRLGEGGMGEVFAAYDERLDRKVAIKLLHAAGESEEAQKRLLREAQALARIAHPNVVGIHEVGNLDGEVFLAMEYIDGQTLRDWQAEAPRPAEELLHVYTEALRGLAAVHAAGLVHRNFKPANVMISRDGRVRLVDFGLAHARGAEPVKIDEAQLSAALATKLTATGAIVGTPAYMSPEQFLGEPLDARSDQYSFCVALFEALYGRHPFAGERMGRLYTAVLKGEILAPPARADVPAHVYDAVARGLSRKRDERWPDVTSLLEKLAAEPAADPAEHGRRRLAFGALTLLVCVAFAVARWKVVLDGDPVAPLIEMLLMALVGLGVLGTAALVFRRTLMRNPFHRSMVLSAVVAALAVAASRASGVVSREPGMNVALRDLMLLGAMAAAALVWSPRPRLYTWIPVLTPWLAVLWLTVVPWNREVVATFGINGTYLAYLLNWHLASRATAARAGGGASRITVSGKSSPSRPS